MLNGRRACATHLCFELFDSRTLLRQLWSQFVDLRGESCRRRLSSFQLRSETIDLFRQALRHRLLMQHDTIGRSPVNPGPSAVQYAEEVAYPLLLELRCLLSQCRKLRLKSLEGSLLTLKLSSFGFDLLLWRGHV